MKQFFTILILTACAAGIAAAQDNKTTVPFSSNSQPRKLVVSGAIGNVTIRGYDGQQAIVETSGGAAPLRNGKQKEPPPGMHRIGSGSGGVDVTEDNNTVRVSTSMFFSPTNLTIQVPAQTSVSVKSMFGSTVRIENVNGEIEADNMSGDVTILNASGSVMAHSMNGKITAVLNSVTPNKAMSFSTFNGTVDVTLPASIKANVKMKSDRGDMFTDFDIKVDPSTRTDSNSNATAKAEAESKAEAKANGKTTKAIAKRVVRVRPDRETTGTINGGGPEIQFTSFNGDILIHKK